MTWTKRIAPVVATAAIAAGGMTLPAVAKTSTHWTPKKCAAFARTFEKKHPHATTKQKAEANRKLTKHGCTNRVK